MIAIYLLSKFKEFEVLKSDQENLFDLWLSFKKRCWFSQSKQMSQLISDHVETSLSKNSTHYKKMERTLSEEN